MPTSLPPLPRRRWRSRLGAFVRWVSTALALATLALFALSFIRYDGAEYRTGKLIRPTAADPYFHYILHTTSALNARGLLAISWWDYESVADNEPAMKVWDEMRGFEYQHVPRAQLRRRAWFSIEDASHWRFAGLGVEGFTRGGTTGSALFIPHWLVIALASTPWLFWRLNRAARRRRSGHCARCGYDRAGLAPEAPCPECGTTLGPK